MWRRCQPSTRVSNTSRDDLIDKLDAFTHNTTAKPYRRTCDGSPLKAA
jgi:hypothetical protein